MTGKARLKFLRDWLRSPFIDKANFNMEEWPSCAVGEGTRLAKLSREGLSLQGEEPYYNGYTGFEATAKFFNLPYDKAHHLFDYRVRTPEQVAKEIDKVLEKA